MAEDWRLRVDIEEERSVEALLRRMREPREVERALGVAEWTLGGRVVVSRDGLTVFVYADSDEVARAAARVVRSLADEERFRVETAITRWQPDGEEWVAPDDRSADDAQKERTRLLAREDAETAGRGWPEWEVRVSFAHHGGARRLAERLGREGVPHVRRWRYVLVGAADEQAAEELRGRLSDEAPAATEVVVEGTFRAAQQSNPFAVIGGPWGSP